MDLEKGPNFDWNITAKKFVTGLVMTVIPVAILYSIDFVESASFPPQYAIAIPLVVAVLHSLLNIIKHWKD